MKRHRSGRTAFAAWCAACLPPAVRTAVAALLGLVRGGGGSGGSRRLQLALGVASLLAVGVVWNLAGRDMVAKPAGWTDGFVDASGLATDGPPAGSSTGKLAGPLAGETPPPPTLWPTPSAVPGVSSATDSDADAGHEPPLVSSTVAARDPAPTESSVTPGPTAGTPPIALVPTTAATAPQEPTADAPSATTTPSPAEATAGPTLMATAATVPQQDTAAAAAAPQQGRRLNVIGISLFQIPFTRDSTADEIEAALASTTSSSPINKYSFPLVNAILNWRWLMPDWTVRVYVPHGYPLVQQLRALGAQVEEQPFDPRRWVAAMAWRFLPNDDEQVDYWASREAESPPTYQDVAPLRAWQQSPYPIHDIQMRPAHTTWNGGTWGARRGFIRQRINSTMADAIATYAARRRDAGERLFGTKYGDDQLFMAAMLWKQLDTKANGVAFVGDSIFAQRQNETCHYHECRRWPAYPGQPDGFMASVNSVSTEQLILCHYREPPYCRRESYGKTTKTAWRDLYELCVKTDFYSGTPIPAGFRRLGMDACPYDNVTPVPF